ncbi:MAG: sensor histidine kinase [Brumimicrobium sp.]
MRPTLRDNISRLDKIQHVENIKIRLASMLSFVILFVCLILALYNVFFGDILVAIVYTAGCGAGVFGLISLYLRRDYKTIYLIYSLFIMVLVCYSLFYLQHTVHLVDFVWMISAIILAFFGYSRKLGYVYLLISIVIFFIFVFYFQNDNIRLLKPRTEPQKLLAFVESSLALILNFYLLYLFQTASLIAEKKLIHANKMLVYHNNKIKQQNEEKTILVKEIHHRVKNNLQIIISLLRMQSVEIEDGKLKKLFEESINRVMSMSLIHQRLYNNDFSNIKFKEYAIDLFETLTRIDTKGRDIKYSVHTEIEKFDIESSVPIGLILNELITNTFKHAFDNSNQGIISLEVKKSNTDKEINMIYKDSGKWKEIEEGMNSFGLSLIEALTEQLEGSLEIIKTDEGTIFSFILKIN